MTASRLSIIAACAGLLGVTSAVYLPVFWSDFVTLDDTHYVWFNPTVQAGLTPAGWTYAWTTLECANWQPITWLSLELDGSFWHDNPCGYHTTNLILHLVNCLVLPWALYRTMGRIWPSIIVAALFALHPLHVESVAWISERKDVLCTLFLLLTLIAYFNYANGPSVIRYLTVLTVFAMGLFAKPMLVTLPILLLLLDYWPLGRFSSADSKSMTAVSDIQMTEATNRPDRTYWKLLLEKVPLFALSFGVGVITILAQKANNATQYLAHLPFSLRIANSFNAYRWYLEKTFFPTTLAAIYPHPEGNLPWVLVTIGVVIVVTAWGYVIWQRRSKPHLFFGWAWFFISLLPVIGLFQVGSQAYADRYTYIPHIGLFVAIVWEVCVWTSGNRHLTQLFGCGLAIVLGCFAWQSHVQVGYWKNSDTLWSHTLAHYPDNGVGHLNFSEYLRSRGEFQRAIEHADKALGIAHIAKLPNGYCTKARALQALDRPGEAEQQFRRRFECDANHWRSLDELAKLFLKLGRQDDAAKLIARQIMITSPSAISIPSDADPLRVGLALAQQGQIALAAPYFEKAVQADPNSASAHNNLALVHAQLHHLTDARRHFLRALELNPDLANAHFNLAEILEAEQDLEGAKHHFAEAARLDPNDTEAQGRLTKLSTP